MKLMIEMVSSLSIQGKRTVKEVALYNFLSLSVRIHNAKTH